MTSKQYPIIISLSHASSRPVLKYELRSSLITSLGYGQEGD